MDQKIFMRSHSNAWRRAAIESWSGNLRIYGFIRSLFIRDDQIGGEFESVDGGILSLYRVGVKLFLQYGNEKIEVDKDTSAKLTAGKPKSRFQVYKKNKIVLDITYKSELESKRIFGDPTAFIEDEDFDVGIFCENVINDPKRQQGIFRRGI